MATKYSWAYSAAWSRSTLSSSIISSIIMRIFELISSSLILINSKYLFRASMPSTSLIRHWNIRNVLPIWLKRFPWIWYPTTLPTLFLKISLILSKGPRIRIFYKSKYVRNQLILLWDPMAKAFRFQTFRAQWATKKDTNRDLSQKAEAGKSSVFLQTRS